MGWNSECLLVIIIVITTVHNMTNFNLLIISGNGSLLCTGAVGAVKHKYVIEYVIRDKIQVAGKTSW